MMRKSLLGLLGVALAVVTGCQTLQPVYPMPATEIQLAQYERVIVDQLYILVDTSSSMQAQELYPEQKAFLQAFVNAMPAANYQVAAGNFGGHDAKDWLQLPSEPFYRPRLQYFADHLELIGGTTDMHLWLNTWRDDVSIRDGRAAVLILSDGRAPLVDTMLAARALVDAHRGQLCIYAVQFGDDEDGGWLLHELRNIARCGQVWKHGEVNTPAALDAMVRRVFLQDLPHPVVVADRYENILFDFDRYFVRPEYHEQLDLLALVMQNNPGIRLRLEGHTDSRGSQAYNQGLSERRAAAVRQALIERGISMQRLEIQGYSFNRPVRPNDSEANMALNRRVEIRSLR